MSEGVDRGTLLARLRDIERMVTAYDALVERTCRGVDTGGLVIQLAEAPAALLREWLAMRSELFVVLGMAYGTLAGREPPLPSVCDHGVPLDRPCPTCLHVLR